jgi:hypothetical protein
MQLRNYGAMHLCVRGWDLTDFLKNSELKHGRDGAREGGLENERETLREWCE